MDSPKKAQLSKAVLNVTTYKKDPEDSSVEIPQATSIDISDLLGKNGVDHIFQIHGISESADDESPALTRFVVDDDELISLSNDIFGIIDAAIVNEKQGKAIKNLITDRFDTFVFKHWDKIRH